MVEPKISGKALEPVPLVSCVTVSLTKANTCHTSLTRASQATVPWASRGAMSLLLLLVSASVWPCRYR